MDDPFEQVSALTTIVTSLGGPNINPDDIRWVMQVDKGRELVEWLVSQVEDVDLDDAEGFRASLSQIALEKEEHDILEAQTTLTGGSLAEVDTTQYFPPSRQRERATLFENLAYTAEKEVLTLENRIQQTKLASKHLAHTMKKLKSEIQQTKCHNEELHERLSELSIENNSVISTAVSRTSDLLEEFSSSVKLVPNSPPEKAYLGRILSLRTKYISNYRNITRAIDHAKERTTSASAIEAEVNFLQAALYEMDSLTGQTLYMRAEEAALAKEMVAISHIVNEFDGTIYEVLQMLDMPGPDSLSRVDIQQEVEGAWRKDQMALLDARESILKQMNSAFEILLQPLQNLRETLSTKAEFLKATADSATDLCNELDDIHSCLTSTQAHDTRVHDNNFEEPLMKQQLIELLKRHEDSRSQDVLPLVLLDDNDLLTELGTLVERNRNLEKAEQHWVSTLAVHLNRLYSSHDAGLSAAYAHAPLNTSPPFAVSPSMEDLRTKIRTKSDKMVELVRKLQADMRLMESEQSRSRLESFVEHWAIPT